MKSLIEKIASDILRADDGYYVYWPRQCGKGYYTSEVLKAIAHELDRLNEPWDKDINDYFNDQPQKDT